MNNESGSLFIRPEQPYGQLSSQKTKQPKKLTLTSLKGNEHRKESVSYLVEQKANQIDTTRKDGQPLLDRENNPQTRVGVKIAGQWYSIYGSPGGLHEGIQGGDSLEGKIAGKSFYLNGVSSGGQPPQTMPQQQYAGQTAAQTPQNDTQGVVDARQRSIIRQTAGKCAAIFLQGSESSPDRIKEVTDHFFEDFMATTEGRKPQLANQTSEPPF